MCLQTQDVKAESEGTLHHHCGRNSPETTLETGCAKAVEMNPESKVGRYGVPLYRSQMTMHWNGGKHLWVCTLRRGWPLIDSRAVLAHPVQRI